MSVEFRFHSKKAVEASALLLKLHGKPMKYLGLLKMLYISDRIALERMEQSITGDDFVSMKYGTVLSGIYDLIKNKEVDDTLPLWQKFIAIDKKDKKSLVLCANFEIEELCEEEEEIIKEVYQKFGHIDPFLIAEWTHSFPEWQNPKIFNKNVIPISIDDILKNLGKTDEEIELIRQEAKREAYLDEVLNV
jgi:uncharacterized phage-associated protein